ncbi:MAG: hypothetical protein RIQ60_300 [Pseudomonadota bacterium]|jgi:hypothetical protein
MNASPRPQALLSEGLIDDVVCRHTGGKKAQVFVVRCGDESCCAEVCAEATYRCLRQAGDAAGTKHTARMLLRDVASDDRRQGEVELAGVMRENEDARLGEQVCLLRLATPG